MGEKHDSITFSSTTLLTTRAPSVGGSRKADSFGNAGIAVIAHVADFPPTSVAPSHAVTQLWYPKLCSIGRSCVVRHEECDLWSTGEFDDSL